jgi:hypothetical protein
MRARLSLLCMLIACGDNATDPRSCALYARPERLASVGCGDPMDPHTLVACDTGSALAGAWTIDAAGLPACDLLIDERCDAAAAATAYSPRDQSRAEWELHQVMEDPDGEDIPF